MNLSKIVLPFVDLLVGRLQRQSLLHLARRPGTLATAIMTERFERHRQAWTPAEIAKLRQLAEKGMGLKAISKSMTRSEESIKTRAKIDKLKIAKKR